MFKSKCAGRWGYANLCWGCAASVCFAVASANGQCGAVATDLVEGYRATGPIRITAPQPGGAAWQFRRGDISGPLLEAVHSSSWTAPAWGSPSLNFFIPCVGPVFSNSLAENENLFYSRLPSFVGIMMHPADSSNSVAIFTAQSSIMIESFSCKAEVLGAFSNGVTLAASTIIDGSNTQRIAPVLVSYTTNGSTLVQATGLPWQLQPGDKVVLYTGANGSAAADWINIRADMFISGGPTLLGPPKDATTCAGGTVQLRALATGSNLQYGWQIFNRATLMWTNLVNGPNSIGVVSGTQSDTLTISGAKADSEAGYRLIVSNSCGSVTSVPVQVVFCKADFTCDGLVEDADFVVFAAAYNILDCADPAMASGCPADLNNDGLVDDSDFVLFVQAYNELGCS